MELLVSRPVASELSPYDAGAVIRDATKRKPAVAGLQSSGGSIGGALAPQDGSDQP